MSQNSEVDAEKDAEILDMRDTLRTLLQRYKDVAFMDSIERYTNEELPVKNAERILDGETSRVVEEEFHLLRKLSLKIELHLCEKWQNEEEINEDEMEIVELIREHRDLKEEQGIIRVD